MANSQRPQRKHPFCGNQDGDIVLTYLTREERDLEGSPHYTLTLKQKQIAPSLPGTPTNKLWLDSGDEPGEMGCWGVPPPHPAVPGEASARKPG